MGVVSAGSRTRIQHTLCTSCLSLGFSLEHDCELEEARGEGRDRASSCSRSQRPLLGFCPAGLRVWCVLGCVCGRCVVVFVCRIDSALDIHMLALLVASVSSGHGSGLDLGSGVVPSTLMQ